MNYEQQLIDHMIFGKLGNGKSATSPVRMPNGKVSNLTFNSTIELNTELNINDIVYYEYESEFYIGKITDKDLANNICIQFGTSIKWIDREQILGVLAK